MGPSRGGSTSPPAEQGIRLGCAPDLSLQRLQSFLGAMYGRGASRAEVVHARSVEQIARLQSGELDVALIHNGQAHTGIATEPLFAGERLVAVLPIGHRLATSQVLGPEDFEQEVLLMPPHAAEPPLTGCFCAVRETLGSQERDLVFAVADGHGIALAPSSILRAAGEVGTTVTTRPVEPALWMPEISVAWRADRAVEDLGELVLAAREIARELRAASEMPLSGKGGALPIRRR
jgi:hypothetical protein